MAAYFWVGGTGTWNNTNAANWSLTSGGAGGAGVPTSADSVTINSSSGTSFAITVASTAAAASVTNSNATVTITLTSNFTTAGAFSHTGGTLDLAGFTLACLSMAASGSTTRTIAFGTTGKISLTAATATTVWDARTATALTMTGSRSVELVGAGTTIKTVRHGDNTAGSITSVPNISTTTAFRGTLTIGNGSQFGNLTMAQPSVTPAALNLNSTTIAGDTFSTASSVTVTGGTLTMTTAFGPACSFTIANSTATSLNLTVQAGDWSISSAASFGLVTLTAGGISLGSSTLRIATQFATGGSLARYIDFGTGKIAIAGGNSTPWNCAVIGGLITSGSRAVEITTTSGTTSTISHGSTSGGSASNPVSITITPSANVTYTVTAGSHLHVFGFTNAAASTIVANSLNIYGGLSIPAAGAATLAAVTTGWNFVATSGTMAIDCQRSVSGPFVINAPGATFSLVSDLTLSGSGTTNGLFTHTAGTIDVGTRTLTVPYFTSNNSNVRSITGSGGAISLTGTAGASGTVWNLGTVINLTTSGSFTVNLTPPATGIATYTVTHASGEESAVDFYSPAGSNASVIYSLNIYARSFTTDASPNTGRTISGSLRSYGDLIFTGKGNPAITLAASSGTPQFTCNNGLTPGSSPSVSVLASATHSVVGNNVMGAVTLSAGGLAIADPGATLSMTSFTSGGAGVRTLQLGTGTTITLTGTSGAVWNITDTTTLTFSAGTSSIYITGISGGSSGTFNGAGLTYYDFTFGGTTSNPILFINGSNTFNTFATTRTAAYTLQFQDSTTTTVTNWAVKGGIFAAYSTIQSSTSVGFNIVKSGGGIARMYWMNVQGMNASPASTWYAPACTNVGSNTNVTFADAYTFYWVGGSGVWDTSSTSNWATSSGGSSSGLFPVLDSPVVFDTNSSGGGPFTVTTSLAQCGNLSVGNTADAMTWAGTSKFTCSGSFSITNSTFTGSATSTVAFVGVGTKTLTINKPLASPFQFNDAGSYTLSGSGSVAGVTIGSTSVSLTLGSNFTSTSVFTLTAGVFALNGYDLVAKTWSVNGTGTKSFLSSGGTVTLNPTGTVNAITYTPTNTTVDQPADVFIDSSASGSLTLAATSGGAANSPRLTVGATTATILFFSSPAFSYLDLSAWLGSVESGSSTVVVYGSVALSPVNSPSIQMSPTSPATLSGGNASNLTVSPSGTTVDLTGDLSFFTFGFTRGTFNANGFNLTGTQFSSTGAIARTLNMGSGTWSLNYSGGPAWEISGSNLTINPDTSTIRLTTAFSVIFNGGGYTYNRLLIGNGTTIPSSVTIQGSNTFNILQNYPAIAAHTINFTAGTSTYVYDWQVSGSVGKFCSLRSTVAGTQANLAKFGAKVGGIDYLDIKDSSAGPSNTWYAGSNSIDSGNNIGWLFTDLTQGNASNFFAFF